jgi:methionyl-tRNA formyltransferase
MKIIFMGTPDFGTPTLQKLIDSTHQISAVFTQAPKPQDRGMTEKKSPVHMVAEAHNIPVHTPKTLKNNEEAELIHNIDADIIIVVSYGFIIPKAILESKKYGCLNLHPSALPRFRGAAPLQRTIIAGDKTTEICIMQMDEGMDTGDILIKKELQLHPRITLKELHDKCAEIGSNLMLQVLENIDDLEPQKQTEEGLLYAPKLTKAEGIIDWNKSAFTIECQVRGMTPWPGVFFIYKGENIKILEAEFIEENHNLLPGTVTNDKLFTIACDKHMLKIIKLQRPGKKSISSEEFLRGCIIRSGEVLR